MNGFASIGVVAEAAAKIGGFHQSPGRAVLVSELAVKIARMRVMPAEISAAEKLRAELATDNPAAPAVSAKKVPGGYVMNVEALFPPFEARALTPIEWRAHRNNLERERVLRQWRETLGVYVVIGLLDKVATLQVNMVDFKPIPRWVVSLAIKWWQINRPPGLTSLKFVESLP